MKKYAYSFIALICSAWPLFAQLERGTVLLSPGVGYSYQKTPQFEASTNTIIATSTFRYAGTGFQLGIMGEKHREWGLATSYEWKKSTYLGSATSSIVYYEVARKLAGSVYHRKYYPLNEYLWTGYQLQLVASVYNGSSEYVNAPISTPRSRSGPVQVLLDANAFFGGWITPHLGARLNLGSAYLGYFFTREGAFSGGLPESPGDRLKTGLGWRPAGAAQFSLLWVLSGAKRKVDDSIWQ